MEREAKERIKMKKAEERLKREEEIRERLRRREERKEERKDMTERERRIERHAGLERAVRSFMDYLNYGENVRTAEIPFNEPRPGCKFYSDVPVRREFNILRTAVSILTVQNII